MGCTSNNATPACPAIAPGAEGIDARRTAERLVARHGPGGMHPRVRGLVPAFDAPFFQAGLAGYSDAAMRIIARRHGCPWCVTEALLDRTLLAGGRGFAKADLGELHDNVPGGEEDTPLAGQIMGSDPAEMAAAALKMVEQRRRHERDYRRLAYGERHPGTQASRHHAEELPVQHLRLPGGEQLGRYDPEAGLAYADDRFDALPSMPCCLDPSMPSRSFAAIDVNLACPVKKISSKARGGHWLAEPAGAIEILEAVREAVPADVLCTVKLRRSFDDTPEMAEACGRILDAAYSMGYAWATVHARTVEQKYVGPSRWDTLRGVVARVRRDDPDRPIFGSGDVWEAGDIFRMIEYTGVTGASVARGCIGNPWIFRQARDLLAGREPRTPTIVEQRRVLEDHFALALAVNAGCRKPEVFTGRVMRKFGIRFAEHHPRAEEVRQRFTRIASLADWREVLDEFYAFELANAPD
ncbi:MAG TPA: tRNA-dihydrouridine synthase family protein [Phycisphaerales bacterium]|nr:tRNA-dihydrouridine synthase family protein [Phycisphaerales bacterium]